MYLLDTHVLLWWTADPSRLSPAQRRVLEKSALGKIRLAISAITLWELALLARRNHIKVQGPIDVWLAELERDSGVNVVPITGRIAYEAVSLTTDFPADPADRIIVATAICHGLTLLTSDRRIRDGGEVAVV